MTATALPLNEIESERFDAIREASNIALVRSQDADGRDVALIAAITQGEDGDDDYRIYPLALVLTDDLVDRLGLQDPTTLP